jgi:hypothetical protein
MTMIHKNLHIDLFRIQVLLILTVFLIASTFSIATGAPESYKTRIKMEFIKKADDSKIVIAIISARIEKKPVRIENVYLTFYDLTDSSQLLDKVLTNDKGLAQIFLPENYPIGRDSTESVFRVEFEGNEGFKSSSKELSIKDVGMDLSYETIDSVYTILVSAYELQNGKPGKPLTDLDVYVYVQRLFSRLKIGEGWLQNGKAIIEIPSDLPGDDEFNLKLITTIQEAGEYGTIEKEGTVNWGWVGIRHHIEKRRALWKPLPPLWMIITLSILVMGVFFHYLLIVYKLFQIKSLDNKDRPVDSENLSV